MTSTFAVAGDSDSTVVLQMCDRAPTVCDQVTSEWLS